MRSRCESLFVFLQTFTQCAVTTVTRSTTDIAVIVGHARLCTVIIISITALVVISVVLYICVQWMIQVVCVTEIQMSR